MMMYNNTVRDYFFCPRHVGTLDSNQELVILLTQEQKGQGTIEFYMQCTEKGLIKKVCFKTNGHPYLIAALEWLCRRIEGQFIDKLSSLEYQELIKILEIPRLQYPLTLRVVQVLKESVLMMKQKLGKGQSRT